MSVRFGGSYILWSRAVGTGAAEGRLRSTSCQVPSFCECSSEEFGGLSSVTGSHSFSPASFFHRVCFFPLILPRHLLFFVSFPLIPSPHQLAPSPHLSSTHVSCPWPQRLAVFLTSGCLILDFYSSYQVLSCHQHRKQTVRM